MSCDCPKDGGAVFWTNDTVVQLLPKPAGSVPVQPPGSRQHPAVFGLRRYRNESQLPGGGGTAFRSRMVATSLVQTRRPSINAVSTSDAALSSTGYDVVVSGTCSPAATSTRPALTVNTPDPAAVVVGIIVIGASWTQQQGRSARGANFPVKSLAVLPFHALGQKSDEHVGLGLADVLITCLSNIRELNVRATSAVVSFDGPEHESISAGRKLNVDAVLEGTIYTRTVACA
ncbi:MAG: hypothetical protein ABR568_05955 [Pyrinomonadaceae bacterium]